MSFKFSGIGLVLATAFFSASASAAPAVLCQSDSSTACWRQITYANFKDFAVGTGMVCMVGGNSRPFAGDMTRPPSDQYLNPNNHSENLGTEDIVECHKPSGVSSFSQEPFFAGYGNNPNNPGRVPGGIYDHGVWGGVPTRVITLYGSGGDDIAVLNAQQWVYVAPGDRNNFKTGGNYATWQLDRKNVHTTTGATLCLKGLFTSVAPTGNTWWLNAVGCNGEVYSAHDDVYVGWIPWSGTYIQAGGGDGWWYALRPSRVVHRETYRYAADMPALPLGLPKALGFRYVVNETLNNAAASNLIYEASPLTNTWTFRDVGYPESDEPGASLEAIDSGERFRGISGEFFTWQSSTRVYLYYPAPVAPLSMLDINIGANTGTRVENLSQETITSKGGDIYSTADVFMSSYRTLSGDGVAITKVVSQSAQSGTLPPYAKAGIMIRESTAANSANVFLGKTPSGIGIQQRVSAGGSTTVTNVSAPAQPTWLRTIRTGNSFIGSKSSDGVTWTQVGDPVVFTTFAASPLVGLGVSSHSTSVTAVSLFDSAVPASPGFEWRPGLTSLLSPWIDATMGMTGGLHDRDMVANTETITASGTDIYNYSDQFWFSFQNVTGNATIIAKLTSLVPVAPATSINPYAKAGVMFRDSITGGSPNAFVAITAAQGGTLQSRAIAGNATPTPAFVTTVGAKTVKAPFWVKATRTGAQKNVYTGYVSFDGVTWTQVGAATTLTNIAATAQVGLAVTSHDAANSVKATFSNVVITQP
jgi:hypothetical protein